MASDTIASTEFLKRFERAARAAVQQRDYLSELDMLGDADLGMNISRGFEQVLMKLSREKDLDIDKILTIAGDTFEMEIGSTIGGLLGHAFVEAGKVMKGKDRLDTRGFAMLLATMLNAITTIGGAKVGDKTLVDALEPAARAMEAAARDNRSPDLALIEAASAAEAGMNSTVNMVARVGRSSYLGERSKGRADPGAAFIAFFLRSLCQPIRAEFTNSPARKET